MNLRQRAAAIFATQRKQVMHGLDAIENYETAKVPMSPQVAKICQQRADELHRLLQSELYHTHNFNTKVERKTTLLTGSLETIKASKADRIAAALRHHKEQKDIEAELNKERKELEAKFNKKQKDLKAGLKMTIAEEKEKV